jgi:Carboxypeptidase regulatory-like domain
MKRQMVCAAFLVVMAASLARVAVAQQSTAEPVGTLEGTVLDAKGLPVMGASVTIQTSDGRKPHATHTNGIGHFEFTRWATGQYDVRAYSSGVFSDWDKHLVIRSKKTTSITLHLPPTL